MVDGPIEQQQQPDDLVTLLARLRTQQGQDQQQLLAAQEQARRTQRSPVQAGLKFLSGAGAAIAGRDPGAAQQRFGQALQQRAQLPVEELKERSRQRAAQLQQTTGTLQVREAGKQAERAQRFRDPGSQESRIKREGLAAIFPGGKAALLQFLDIEESAFGQITAQDADALLKNPVEFKAKADQVRIKVQREQDKLDIKQRQEKDKRLSNNVRKFSETINKTGIPAAQASFDAIRESLKDLARKQARVEGREIDETSLELPGFIGFRRFLPSVLLEKETRQLNIAVQNLANQALKDLSGAAVSAEEFKRFKKGIGLEELKSPEILLRSLNIIFDQFSNKSVNILAGVDRETSQLFFERGGKLAIGPDLIETVRGAGSPEASSQRIRQLSSFKAD